MDVICMCTVVQWYVKMNNNACTLNIYKCKGILKVNFTTLARTRTHAHTYHTLPILELSLAAKKSKSIGSK